MDQAEYRANTPYGTFGSAAVAAPEEARRTFIRKTYMHLAAAVYAFAGLEWFFISQGWDEAALRILGNGGMSWLLVLGAFIVVSWVANSWALNATSIGMQYAGLFLYVFAESIIFLPLLALAKGMSTNVLGPDINVIAAAGITTAIMFAGLTAVVFLSGKDFSFLGKFLGMTMIGALALIVASVLFGFNLGIWFVVAMIFAACGYILYYTSQIMHQFRTDQYVAAALALFASVALLFWYVLQLLLSMQRR
jgi:FtsH-binding integral membrane protein